MQTAADHHIMTTITSAEPPRDDASTPCPACGRVGGLCVTVEQDIGGTTLTTHICTTLP